MSQDDITVKLEGDDGDDLQITLTESGASTIEIQEDGTSLGTAGGINLSTNLTASISGGIATIDASGASYSDEQAQDAVGNNTTVSGDGSFNYDDANNQLEFTIDAPVDSVNGSTGTVSLNTDDVSEGGSNLYFTDERVDDRVNNLLVGGTNVTLTYDDAADSLTIDAAGGTDTRVDLSQGGSLVLSEPTDVNFTESGAASVTVSDDGDGTATVDVSATDTDTQLSKEEVQDDAWDVLTGSQTLINVTYDDANNEADFVVNESGIDHDNLTNFASNEHIDHSTVSISSGTGLSGGGDITASRTLSLDAATSDLNDAASPNATAAGQLLIYNATNSQFENNTLTGGSNVSITNSDAAVTIDATDTDTRVETQDAGTTVYTDTDVIDFDANLSITDNGGGSITVDAASSTDTTTGVSESGTEVLAQTDDINFTSSGSASVTVTDDTDGTVTVDVSATDTDTDTRTDVSNDGATAVTETTDINFGSGVTASDDGDGTATVAVTESEIAHDSLSGFVSSEHVDHSTVSISSGTGLSGGGDLTSSRTLSLNASVADLNDAALPNGLSAGQLLIYDGTSGQFENATLTAGTNVSITEGDASITIDSTDTDTRVETQDGGTTVYTDTDIINFGSNLTVTDDTGGQITVDAASSTDTTTGVSENGTEILAQTDDINFTSSGSASISVTDDTDGTVTVDVSATDTDTDTRTDISEAGTTVVSDTTDINFTTSNDASATVTDDTDGTATVDISTTVPVDSVAGKTGAVTLASNDLTDVNVSTPAAGETLLYDATNSEFVNATITAGNGLTSATGDGSFTVDIVSDGVQASELDFGDGLEDNGTGTVKAEEQITVTSGGITEWADGLSNEEVDRLVLQSGETLVIDRIEVRQKGGGSSTSFSVRVQDVTAASTVGSQNLGGTTKNPGSTGSGNTVAVQLSNSTGGVINASYRVIGRIQGA